MNTIVDNELFFVEHDATRKLVRMRRKGAKIASVDWENIMSSVLAAVQPLRGQRLLLDVRLAPGNNDPQVEQKVHGFRRHLSQLFPVSATVVATAVGRLQVLRMSRERGEINHIFLDEAEAIAYLLLQDVIPPAR